MNTLQNLTFARFKGNCAKIFLLLISSLADLFFGCAADTNCQSYKDQKNQGEKIFLSNLNSCQDFSKQNVKRGEGSKAAGELLRGKNFIFYSCMKRNYWILKK